MKRWVVWVSCVAAAFLSGCANFNSIHRMLDTSTGKGALVDAKQRAILVGNRVEASSSGVAMQRVICPEPSPDALAAYAAEIAATSEKVGAQLAASFQESAASIGVRTSSIQLLRDQISYNCIDYMNGASSKEQHDLRARRAQKHTVALMAIEQLTGAVRAPSVTISTIGSAETSRSLTEMSSQVAGIDASLAELAAKKAATTDAAASKAIDDEVARLTSVKGATLKAIESARGLLASGSATSVISAVGMPTASTAPQEKVVEAVRLIVQDIINADDTPQLCLSRLAAGSDRSDGFGRICVRYFEQVAEMTDLKLREVRARIEQSAGLKASDSKRSANELNTARQDLDLLFQQSKSVSRAAPNFPLPPLPAPPD
ncbi:hypothetical protein [Variovorax sp. ZT4R33]|uniref:hypothetical protein n=1 Tax=Variovorax sp. ZT4R33 TaxID=3443743 RepID=UPI003F448BCD